MNGILFKRRLLAVTLIAMLLVGASSFGGGVVSAASKLKVTPSTKTIYVGNKATFKANKNVKWSVVKGKKYIKVVSKKNRTIKIQGVKKGTAYIKARVGKKYRKIKVVVKPAPAPTKITLTADKNRIDVNNTCKVSVKSVSPSLANKSVTYSSSNEDIAKVDKNGKVTGIGSGRVYITATSTLNKKVTGKVLIYVDGSKSGRITLNIDLTDTELYPEGEVARVWIPVPETNSDWKTSIPSVKYTFEEGAEPPKVSKRYRDSAGNKVWYIEWDENAKPEDRIAHMSYTMETRSTVCDVDLASEERGSVNTSRFEEYLEENSMSGSITSGPVKELADQIVKEAKARTVYEKAHAIYLWETENLYKDNLSDNFCTGDVLSILEDKTAYGCQDINAVFTALCNAVGIPAREVFGMKLTNANGVPTAKCHAEFYMPGYGWVPCDAYDALKAIKGKEDEYRGVNAEKADEWKQIKDHYWAYREEGWLAIATGRDIALNPAASASDDEYVHVLADDTGRTTFNIRNGKLNLFMNPYGEYGDEALTKIWSRYQTGDNKKPKFYNYGAIEEDPSCGC